jgi:hypothetical protein
MTQTLGREARGFTIPPDVDRIGFSPAEEGLRIVQLVGHVLTCGGVGIIWHRPMRTGLRRSHGTG